ncbi:MAG: IS3 family transposase, partial [Gemmobacter sp.]|nr:IS3 family transposase [Gemmobacter sp.]
AHARDPIADRVTGHDTERPRSALGCQTPAGSALHPTTAGVRPAARDESSARRAIARPASRGVNQLPAADAPG